MKKISIFTRTGLKAAITYYRFAQYLREIDINCRYYTMMADQFYEKVMPISKKPLYLKAPIFIYIYIRVLFQLSLNLINKPDTLILSRRFISQFFPYSFRLILKSLKSRGTCIIWDFDDNILASKEISKSGFDFMSEISDYILVASDFNKRMVNKKFHNKVKILPTTDGDMFTQYNKNVTDYRLELFKREIRLIWVGTFSSIRYLREIMNQLEAAAQLLKIKQNKDLILTVVCNKPLIYESQNFLLRNIVWERDVAISEMLKSHIGLMPIHDNNFTKGKGGFKLIQYLSIGLPVIGSAVGINNQIISPEVGIAVPSLKSDLWANGIEKICNAENVWLTYSNSAYNKWLNDYDYSSNLNYWKNII